MARNIASVFPQAQFRETLSAVKAKRTNINKIFAYIYLVVCYIETISQQ